MPWPSGNRAVRWPTLLAAGVLLVRSAETEAQVAPPPSSWVLVGHFRETYDTNPFVRGTGLGEGSFVHRTGLDFRRVITKPRGHLDLGGQGSAVIYQTASQFNYFEYGATGAGSYLLSPRSRLSFTQDFASSYRYRGLLLGDSTQLLPPVRTRVSATTAGLELKLSTRTTLGIRSGYRYASFDSPTLVDGSSLRGGLGLARRISTRDSLTLDYGVQRISHGGFSAFIQTLAAGWTRAFGEGAAAQVTGGMSYYERSGAAVATWRWYGTAGVDKTFGKVSIGAHYSHAITQAFGLGRDRVVDAVRGTFRVAFTRRFALATSGAYGYSKDPVLGEFLFETVSANGALNFQAARHLGLSAGYAYRHRRNPAAMALTSQQVFVSLSAGWQWR